MTSKDYRWLITDIDGTLLDEAGNLPPRNLQALRHCRDRGIPVVLATGRRWTTLKRLLDRLEMREVVDFAVFNNGMVVRDLRARDALHREDFPHDTLLQAALALESLDLDPIALTYDPAGETDVFYRRLSLMNGDFVDKNVGFSRPISRFDEMRDQALVELILLGQEPELRRAQAALAGLPLETALIQNTFYAGYMLEITPAGVSKFSGADRIAAVLGLTVGDAVAIGDSANDLPLLRKAGRSIAVRNASEEVRGISHETVASNDEAGVAEAVFRHFP